MGLVYGRQKVGKCTLLEGRELIDWLTVYIQPLANAMTERHLRLSLSLIVNIDGA
ncbi:MAG: hypothetical protein ACI84C_002316 [Flavobacteriales bacterium]|jgi:hypothetical protein